MRRLAFASRARESRGQSRAKAGTYGLLLWGVEGFDRLYTSDEDGYTSYRLYPAPTMIYLYAAPFPECPSDDIDVALVPRAGEFRFVLDRC